LASADKPGKPAWHIHPQRLENIICAKLNQSKRCLIHPQGYNHAVEEIMINLAAVTLSLVLAYSVY
jgi:hypothetical protein